MFQPKQIPGSVSDNMDTMNVNVATSGCGSPTLVLHKTPPSSIPGLRTFHSHTDSTLSTPSSEESNSPTDLNSYKRMTEKPPLIKRLAVVTPSPTHEEDPTSNLLRTDITPKHIELDNNR